MTTGKALNGKPYAGNPHVRFDEGEVASAATPRRGALLYKTIQFKKAKRSLIAALAFAATAAFAAVPDALIHRWSFNNSLEDTGSIGGKTAVLGGNAALYGETSVRVQRGGDPVELGANPIPSDLGDTPFTIEVWATPTTLDTYRGMFSLGERSNTSAKGLMGVFQGYRQINYTGGSGGDNGPVWHAVAGTVNGGTGKNVAMTPGGISANTPYYFAYVVTPTGDGSATVAGYVYNVSTGAQVGKSVAWTVESWTTSQLAQSWFGLGTTPWNDACPGADYDEVRVWKKALTPADVAANVKVGPDAIPGDGDYPTLGVSEANLAHRWSFNGSLVDSVTEDVATMAGGSYTADGVRFVGGSRDSNYVSLGANKMPSDNVTLEFFSTTRTLGWPKMFCLGNSTSDGISFSFQRGGSPDAGMSGIEIYDTSSGHYVNGIPNALELNKPYLFTFTFSCDGTDTVLNGYCIDLANPGAIRGQFTRTIPGWTLTEKITLNTFNLGWSFWGDSAPSADFDEVRVWDGVLSATEILASAAAGADAIVTKESDPNVVLFEYDFSGGANNFSGIVADPVVNDASYLAVHGTNGYGTAVHPAGYGPIALGEQYLNDDWTLAMSVKSCDVENGILLAIGGNGFTSNGRELRILSSSTPGKLSAVIAQTWDVNYEFGQNTPASLVLTDLGDTTGSFHTLVAVHTKDDAKIKLYWDGVFKGEFNSLSNMGADKVFRSNLQFGGSLNNTIASHVSTASNLNVAFQNVTLYMKALDANAISEYAAKFPSAAATTTSIDGQFFGYGFTTGEKVYSGTIEDPVTVAAGYTAVNGANGYGTAVHACGYGIDNDEIKTALAGEWSLAMSFKSCNIEKGAIISLGNIPANGTKQLAILSSSTEGRLYAAVVQRWGNDATRVNRSLDDQTIAVSGADFTKEFHTLVVTHVPTDATHTGVLTIYVDGVQVHQFTTVNFGSERVFGGGFRFGALMDNGGTTSLPSDIKPTAWCPDVAFQDVRLYKKAFNADEALAYALAFPAVAAATSDIGDVTFRHDFTGGTLSATGDGWTDSGLAGTGTAVGVPGGAAFPSKDGYGTVVGGLSRDWTMAMQFRGPEVSEGKAVMFSYGGVENGNKRSISICRTAEGKLVAQTVQNWGGGVNATSSIELGDDADRLFHTLVIVNERDVKTDYRYGWASGMQSFYLDGEFVGAITDNNGQERALMDTFRYGAIYNRTFNGITEPTAGSGLAFRDLRFATNVWTSAEAKAYALDRQMPGEDFLFGYRFTSGEKHFYGNGFADPVTVAAGYTPVHGTSGYGTAVHATGYGINNDDIKKALAGNWSLAMSFKSCDIEKGAIISLGDIPANGTKQLAILSSSTEGRLYAAVVQRWGGTTAINRSLNDQTIEVSGADFAKEFHTLVVTHVPTDATHTGVLTIYVDGVQVHQFTTVNFASERVFGGGFRFGALMDNGRTTSLPGDITSTAYCPDTAFQDVRFFTKVLSADEIAAYAAMFPAAAATKSDIDDYGFRHDFSSGKLVLTGDSWIDGDGEGANGIVGTGTSVPGPKVEGKITKAAFPSKDGYGSVDGGLNRDWTLAMSVKAPAVAGSEKGIVLAIGGVDVDEWTTPVKALVLCSDANGGFYAKIVQRWGSGEDAVNDVGSIASLTIASDNLGGGTTNGFHTLVVVNERDIKTDEQWNTSWKSGMVSFYWDGVYKGSLTGVDGQGPTFTPTMRYGAIYNRTYTGSSNFVESSNKDSGLAFYDLRFIPQVWTSAEAADYAAKFPVAEQSKMRAITIFVR